MTMMGDAAVYQREQQMNEYRRRVREVDQPIPNDDVEEEDGQDDGQDEEVDDGQDEEVDDGQDDDVDEAQSDNSDSDNSDEQREPTAFEGTGGVRLGGDSQQHEEVDPKEARMKWLEEMSKK
jgi:hypothetical protein